MASCTPPQTELARSPTLPPKSPTVNTAPVRDSVIKVDDYLTDVKIKFSEIKGKLDDTAKLAEGAVDKAAQAYEKGIEAGSNEAKSLKENVAQLLVTVSELQNKAQLTDSLLLETKEELKVANQSIADLQSSVVTLTNERDTLRVSLVDCGNKLNNANSRIVSLEKEAAVFQDDMQEQKAKTNKWFWTAIISLLFIVLYLYLKTVEKFPTLGLPTFGIKL